MSGEAYQVIRNFEKRVAEYSGAPYAIAVSSCTNALFLCLKWCKEIDPDRKIVIPARTYISVPLAIIHAKLNLGFDDFYWEGVYQLYPYPLFDAAKRFKKNMFVDITKNYNSSSFTTINNLFVCLSFHGRKILNIGEGGMILTDCEESIDWFKKMRYSGRDEVSYSKQKDIKLPGYKMHMTPEQAARGLVLMDFMKDDNPDQIEDYTDLRKFSVFKKYL